MKYFTSELLLGVNSEDKTEKRLAMEQLECNSKQYDNLFKKTQKYLSKQFLKAYLDSQSFHDCIFSGIDIQNNNNKSYGRRKIDITLKIQRYDGICFDIIHKDVCKYSLNISKDYWMCNEMSWGYSEIYIKENGMIEHNLLCDLISEIDIVCKSIGVNKVKS